MRKNLLVKNSRISQTNQLKHVKIVQVQEEITKNEVKCNNVKECYIFTCAILKLYFTHYSYTKQNED